MGSIPTNKLLLVFYILLGLLLFYSSFVSLYVSFFKHGHFDFLTVFFIFTLIAFTLTMFHQIYKFFQEKLHLSWKNFFKCHTADKKNIITLILIVVLTVITAYTHVHSQYPRGLHVAELAQYGSSESKDVIKSAWVQQQVPLDYYFHAFTHSLFERGKLAVRFHAISFYLILSFILPIGIWFLSSSLWVTGIGSLLFLANHSITLHSVDGRPLSLVLLTGFLFLFFYLLFFMKEEKKTNILNIELLSILASQYLFVMSIGLQPVILVISLFLSSFLLFNKKREVFKSLFLTHCATGILSLPFYTKMISFGESSHKFSAVTWGKLASYIKNFNIGLVFQTYFFPFYEQLKYFFFYLVVGAFTLMIFKRKKSDVILTLILTSTIFTLIFDLIFTSFINWWSNKWYFIVLGPLPIFLATFILKDFLTFTNSSPSGKKFKKPMILIIVTLFSWNLYSQFAYMKKESQYWYPYMDDSIEQVYDYVKEHGTPDDFLVQLSFTQLPFARSSYFGWVMESILRNEYEHPKVISYTIEITKTPPFFHELTKEIIPFIDWEKDSKQKEQKVFFVAQHDTTYDHAYLVLSSFMEKVRIGRFSIFEWVFRGGNKEEKYKEFLAMLIEKTPHKYRAALYEILLYYACKNGNDKKFNSLLEDYRKLEPYLDEIVDDRLQFLPKFAIKRRWNFFKNQSYCTYQM